MQGVGQFLELGSARSCTTFADKLHPKRRAHSQQLTDQSALRRPALLKDTKQRCFLRCPAAAKEHSPGNLFDQSLCDQLTLDLPNRVAADVVLLCQDSFRWQSLTTRKSA